MKYYLLAVTLLWTAGFALGADAPSNASPVQITLHDSTGLSAASAPNHQLELNLFKSHTHMHLRISNTSEQPLTLWKPVCPEGDDALVIEFRDPASPSKVHRATPGWSYTAGMGLPKVFTLAAHDDVIVNLDFLDGLNWVFPIRLADGESRELEVRTNYRSQNLSDEKVKAYGTYKIEKVWEGEHIGTWDKITVRNASGKAIGPR